MKQQGFLHRLTELRRYAVVAVTALCLAAGSYFEAPRTVPVHLAGNDLPVVLIDPGHGGFDGGAVSPDGVLEKDLNLHLSKKLELVLLERGFQVVMTRREDKALTLNGEKGKSADLRARVSVAQEYPESVLISIHMNKFEIPKYCGSQVFYSKTNNSSKLLAQCIQDAIREEAQPENERQIKEAGREIYLLEQVKQPCVLVECGFLSNPEETQLLCDPNYQQQLAEAIASGLQSYYNKLKENCEQTQTLAESVCEQGEQLE